MDSETPVTDYHPSVCKRMLAAVGPLLWIAVSYIDPGKWATAVEGGARFGFDIALLMLIINLAAILCQYLSACIPIATGKDLAQICREEYDGITCVLIGVQAETSLIVLDLTMVLGTAYGINAVFGIDLFICIYLTGFDAVLFPFLASLLEDPKAEFLSICLACFILVSYVCGILISQPESLVSMGWMLKLSGENAYILMSLLGANIMPHNFYLHSSIVQQNQGQKLVSKDALCHDHLFATLCIFSGLFLVNCMLMNSAANVFYSSGLISLTLLDALSLLDQVSKSPISSVALILIMFFSNQLISLPWSLCRRVICNDFFGIDIPCWLHRATIRIVAIIPALYCVWNSGAEGIFQLSIFTHVVVALLLPSSVIPLFQIASSRSIMGAYRISYLVKFFALITFVGMLGLKIFFVMEMLFGGSEWVSSLKWNIGSDVPISYVVLLLAAFSSLCFMLRLAITPLRSTSLDTRALKRDHKADMPELSMGRNQTEIGDVQYQLRKALKNQEPALSCPDLDSSEMLWDSNGNLDATATQGNKSEISFSKSTSGNHEASVSVSKAFLPRYGEGIKTESLGIRTLCTEKKGIAEKRTEIEEVVQNGKDDGGDPMEPEESTKDVSGSNPTLTYKGTESLKSVDEKLNDVGSRAGSLSRLVGLSHVARRQLATILDEFWGQLFDFHGQVAQYAKAKKLDILLGIDSKVSSKSSSPSAKLDSCSKESADYISTTCEHGRKSSVCNSSIKQIGWNSTESKFGVQQGAVTWSKKMQLLDAYGGHTTLDSNERRYSSLHVLPSCDVYNQYPATGHGYDISLLSKEKGADYVTGRLELLNKTSTSRIKFNTVDSRSRPFGRNPRSGLRSLNLPGIHKVPVSHSSLLKSGRLFADLRFPEHLDSNNSPGNTKKFSSLPTMSGCYTARRDSSLSFKRSQCDNYVGCTQSIRPRACDKMSYSALSWPSRDALSLQLGSCPTVGSLWSKQLHEHFGVAVKSPPTKQETLSAVDMEAKLLQCFRICIMKLLKLEGSDWLFRQNDGADEDLIDRLGAREGFLYELESRALGFGVRSIEPDHSEFVSVPNCGDECVWRVDLIISFGVWCIRRVLQLSLMERRPELWGKYTYVLNRLQGVIDLAFTKPRPRLAPCFCLQLPLGCQQKSSPPISNGSLPSKPGHGRFTTAPMLLDIAKDVEIAISSRKDLTGTAAGDVAFPKRRENLASVLKQYKCHLSSKSMVA